MHNTKRMIVATFGLCLAIAGSSQADDWLGFRGPGGSSVSETVTPPVSWNVETGENIAWTADLPGTGVSSPIVVAGRVIVTAASGPDRDRLHVLAFDSMTGKPLWKRQFWATGRTLCYQTSSVAAPTPVSDGQHVFAFYSSNDLVCLDLDGNLKWMRGLTADHPGLGNDIGMAASPVVSDGVVVVQCECATAAFAAGFDVGNGATKWEIDRPEESNWTSPAIVTDGGAAATPASVLLQGRGGLSLHAIDDGSALWQADGEGASISSPAGNASGSLMFVPTNGITALKRTTDGMEVVWRQTGAKSGSPSPVAYGNYVFVLARGGILGGLSIDDGAKVKSMRKRLGGTVWATPLAAGGRLYCINQEGKATVVDTNTGETLAECEFGEDIYGSPAAADGGMFVRSNSKLWKIATVGQAKTNGQAISTANRVR